MAVIDNNGGIWNCPLTYTKEFKLWKSKPFDWSFDKATGTLTVSGSRIPDYMGENAKETLPPWFRATQENQYIDGEINPVNVEIKKIVIEEGCVYIGANAFGSLSGVTEVSLPSTLITIAPCAFAELQATKIEIPDSVVSIGEHAFADSLIEELVIPDSVKRIGNYAFAYMPNLTSLQLGKGLEKVGQCAFTLCPLLESVTIPESLTTIGCGMFSHCEELREVIISQNTKYYYYSSFEGCNKLNAETKTSLRRLGMIWHPEHTDCSVETFN